MKNYIGLFFVLACFFIACNSSENQEAKADSSQYQDEAAPEKDENTFPQESIAFINGTGFSKYAKSAIPELDWSKFTITRFWKEDFSVKMPFTPDEDYYAVYGEFLKFSPDSSKFIDLDSYNIDIRRDQKGRLIGNEDGPDTEVSLVDIKSKQRNRLVFLGPGNSVEDAAWIDNNTLLLIGFQENATATATNAAVWKFDLSRNMVHVYELDDQAVVTKLKDYSKKERLKNVIIR